METETQRPKNERTPGGPVGEGRRGSWERAPRPPFRPTPFQAENPRSPENLRSLQPRKKRAPGFFFFLIGGLLLLTAAVFTVINLVEAEQARRAAAALIDALPSELSEELSVRPSLEAKDSSKRPEPDWPMPQRIVNGEEIIGVIEIPRTGLMLPVLSSWDYDKLKRYPCYYHGSIYRKDAVFCSHDYPFQFGGLNVLEDGDEARFLDADGNIFTYAFREQEYLQPTDVEAMTFKDDWDLTLFTCAYNGLARYAYRFEETGFRAKP
ncbi:MAG: sortase [Clostridiales bacterium]|nr:sortase [Clostridiales bacterium]MDD7431880.1 sortase [Clostridiales bacterium]MDY3062086.1 sortase [Eubacteriales bacterium]